MPDDQILRDRELTDEEIQWMHDQNDKLDRAMARLDAEVAAHEGGEIEPYLVRHPEMLEDLAPDPDIYGDGQQRGAGVGEPVISSLVTAPDPDPSLDQSLEACPAYHAEYGWCYYTGGHARHESALGSWEVESQPPVPVPAPAQEKEPRFGERLRGWAKRNVAALVYTLHGELHDLADAIDRDRDAYRHHIMSLCADQEVERLGNLRRQVEEAVERLKYTVTSPDTSWGSGRPGGQQICSKDVLDAEAFLLELDRIFGDRPEMPARVRLNETARWFEIPGREGARGLRVAVQLDGQTHLWPLDPEVGSGFALSGEAARDLEIILRAFLPGDVALAAEAVAALEEMAREREPDPEHEPAHDRRERASARNEDSRGHVEGVDR